MTVDAGMAELSARMADQAGGGPGVHFDASVGLDLRIGRLVSIMEQERQRRAALSQMINVVDMPVIDFKVTAGAISFKAYRAAASDNSPQEGLMWFVQRVSVAGLTVADVVNLHRVVSGVVTAPMTALHTFTCPPGVAAGLGVADWEPGTNGLVLRPDDALTLVSAGTVTATELILSGQAIQVDLRVLSDFLM
jgi:hypothetical protein